MVEQIENQQRSKIDEGDPFWTTRKKLENGLEQGIEGLVSLCTFTPSMGVDLYIID